MGNSAFIYNNWLKTGTLTSSSAAVNWPLTNIHHRWPTRTWRTTSLADPDWVKVNMGSAMSATALAIRATNLIAGATVKLQVNSSDAWVSPAEEFAVTLNATQMIKFFTMANPMQWFRIYIKNAANPDGYIEVGHAMLSTFLNPTAKPSQTDESPTDPSVVKFSAARQVSSVLLPVYRTRTFVYRGVTDNEKATFDAFFEAVGLTRPFYFTEDYTTASATTTFFCRLAAFHWTPLDRFGYWNLEIVIEDLL